MMKFLRSRVSHSAIMFASGLVIGGGLLGGLPRLAEAGLNEPAPVEHMQTDRCAGSNEVSSFVCRNTWMASTRYSHR